MIEAAVEKARQKKEAIARRRSEKQAARDRVVPRKEPHPADAPNKAAATDRSRLAG
jgi:hypothetical protein